MVIIIHYHTHANVLESMGKPCSCTQLIKKPFFFTTSHMRIHIRYYKSHENPYQVLQVTCVRDLHLNMQIKSKAGSYDKIIITVAPSYTKKKISLIYCCWHCYSCCALVTIQMATNSLYYGDTYIVSLSCTS